MVKEKKYAKGSGARLVARVYETVYDVLHGKVQRRFKRLPVLISYEYEKRRYEKAPDPDDLACIQMAEARHHPLGAQQIACQRETNRVGMMKQA